MRGTRLVLLVLALAGIIAAPASAAERLVTGGVVRGADLPDGSTVFRGIPFAAPPVGDLRWKPPTPVVSWPGIRDATKPPPPCLQHDENWNTADAKASQEDCLYLSLRSPKHEPTDRLPVLFWIHGGSNKAGSGFGYADSTIVQRGVVVVAIEYRLGIFGFLASTALSAESPQHVSGNYGLLDQIAALQWVKANIANFGGDPENVTIGGQSAGAYDVGQLILSPLARGLFKGAVMESAPFDAHTPPRSEAGNEKLGEDLAAQMGVTPDDAGLAALRAAPAAALIAAGDKLVPPDGLDPSMIWMHPVIDGYFLPDTPANILARGEQNPVPLIIGNNSREFPIQAADGGRAMIAKGFGAKADAALPLYGVKGDGPPVDDPVLGSPATQFIADAAFRCPANAFGAALEKTGTTVWRYQFGVPAASANGIVAHNAELSYVFDAQPPKPTLASWPPVQTYWANFIKAGDPNAKGLPRWPGMSGTTTYMAFTRRGPKVSIGLREEICRLMNTAG